MKELTAHQGRIHDMRRPVADGGGGKTAREIAAELGISTSTVAKTFSAINQKLGIAKKTEAQTQDGSQVGRAHEFSRTENTRPEVAAAAIVALADPTIDTFAEAIRRANAALVAGGIPGKVSDAILRRMRVKFGGAITEIKATNTATLMVSTIQPFMIGRPRRRVRPVRRLASWRSPRLCGRTGCAARSSP